MTGCQAPSEGGVDGKVVKGKVNRMKVFGSKIHLVSGLLASALMLASCGGDESDAPGPGDSK